MFDVTDTAELSLPTMLKRKTNFTDLSRWVIKITLILLLMSLFDFQEPRAPKTPP